MRDLTGDRIYRTFFRFALPLVLSGLLSQAYNLVDTVIAGRYLGQLGLAATGATAPALDAVSSIFWGYCVGASLYVAQLFGAAEHRRIKSVMYASTGIAIGAALLISGGLLLFHNSLFAFLKIDPAVWDEALRYFAVYTAGLTLIILQNNFLYMNNAFGISLFPFIISLLSAVLNIGGNILTVAVLGMGAEGLALSTVFSALVADVCYVFQLRRCLGALGVRHHRPSWREANIRYAFTFSLPCMAQQMVMYLSGLFISPMVNGLGAAASAGYAVVQRLYSVNSSVFQNSAKTLSNYNAQCVGMKKYDALPRGVRVGLLQGVCFALPFVTVCALFPEPICSLFFRNEPDVTALGYAVTFARVFLPFILLSLICNLFHAFFRGIKDTKSLFGMTCFGAVVRVTASALLIGPFGMNGFYAGWVISWGLEAVLAVLLYASGRWRRCLPTGEI